MPMTDAEALRIQVIELWPPTDFCCVCGDEVRMEFGLPMYESEIVPADHKGEWGGFTACKRCYELFRDIKEPISVRVAYDLARRERGDDGKAGKPQTCA